MSRLLTTENQTQRTKNNIGPIRWMAPESIFKSEYSNKSDVFMYGMFLYEVIFRKSPFYAIENLLDVGDAVAQGIRPE